MTIFLTGGSGFLGSHVAEQLSTKGRKVRALVRRTSNTKFLEQLDNVELFEGAMGDAESLERGIEGCEGVIHAAGLVKAKHPEDFNRVNCGGTVNLLNAAKKNKELKRFVLVSSLAAIGPSADGTPVPDDRTPQPVTHYGRSKLAAERACQAVKDEVPVTIIRPPAIYGPRDNEILAFFQAVNKRVLPYLGSTDNTLSMIYGGDCAAACIAAVDADVPSGSAFFVEDGKVHVFSDMIADVEAALGKRALLRFPIPKPVLRVAALGSETYGKVRGEAVMLTRDKLNELFEKHWVCDGTPAREALGWKPEMDFSEGARITAKWYQDEGWL